MTSSTNRAIKRSGKNAQKRRDLRTRGSPRAGTAVIWPKGLEVRYGISPATRWRWERSDPSQLPKRDVFVGGIAVGWKPETLEKAERGDSA
jgi:hypothetical protein